MDTSHKPGAHKEEKLIASEHTICKDMRIKPFFHLSNWTTLEKLIFKSQGSECFMCRSVKTDMIHLEINLAKTLKFSMIHSYEFMPRKHSFSVHKDFSKTTFFPETFIIVISCKHVNA